MHTPEELAERLDGLLPQTQCRQCGYPGCRPYAEAIAARRAGIDQCPPGGNDGARELATVAGVEVLPVDRRFGEPKPPAVAVIDESVCIGCTLCVEACPVDAIAGASKLMHTVIAQLCTGCELCIPPCPVDCIDLKPAKALLKRDDRRRAAEHARLRFERRNERLANARKPDYSHGTVRPPAINRNIVERAVERAHARLQMQAMPPK